MSKSANKTALICGVSGQDGSYLARFLLDKGYRVIGTSRDAQTSTFANLRRLGIFDRVETRSMILTDFRSVLQVLSQTRTEEIYNLSGQTSVGLSFQQPMETFESITVGTVNLLEAIRFLKQHVRLYNAGSSECFGDTGNVAANEETAFRPRSPYATAKSAAHWAVSNYREAYGMFASTGILFNHDSPLRPKRFVTQKIVTSACAIANGDGKKLKLGNLSVSRDWGWAPEYVEAMWLMLQTPESGDFVISTGENHTLEEFCRSVFERLNLNMDDHVEMDSSLLRPSDIRFGAGNASKAFEVLGWRAKFHMREVVAAMVEAEMANYE